MTYTLRDTGERFLPWSGDYITGYEHVHRYLLACRHAKHKRVLDISCGEGYGTAMLGQVARHVIGVDIDFAVVAHASEQYGSEHIHFVCADAQQFALAPASVDMIVSFETLEHFEGHEAFIAAMNASLSTGGILMISTPNRLVYRDEAEVANPFHKLELDRAEFIALLRRYFRHVQLFGQRLIASSVIAKSDDRVFLRESQQSRFLVAEIDPTKMHYSAHAEGSIDPRYYIAICSNTPLPTTQNTVMVDNLETLYKDFLAHYAGWYQLNSDNFDLRAQTVEIENQLAQARSETVEALERDARLLEEADQRTLRAQRRLADIFVHLADRSDRMENAAGAISPNALILIPGSVNYFYNQAGRRIATALQTLGFSTDVVTLQSYAPREYDWCFLVNPYEVGMSDATEGGALARIADIQGRTNRMAAVLLECVDTPWFGHTDALCTAANIPLLLDFGFHDQATSLSPNARSRYQFALNGLTETERQTVLDDAGSRADFPIPWMFVGHYSPARSRLISRLVDEFDPSGFVYMPKIAPVTEDGPHINERQLVSTLARTRYQIWCSHHQHFYLESERFRNSLLAGGLPIKVMLHPKDPDLPDLFDYLLFAEDQVATQLRTLDFMSVRDRFIEDFLSLPTLEDSMVKALATMVTRTGSSLGDTDGNESDYRERERWAIEAAATGGDYHRDPKLES